MTNYPDLQPAAADVRKCLEGGGVHQALEYLNSRTRHRFTGAYRFDGDMLRCHRLFDRENPRSRIGSDLVLRDSYCGIVGATNDVLEIEDAQSDPRLTEHPARHSMLAYQGVPLRADGGTECLGTLCHWDHRPRLLTPGELEFLQSVAPLIAEAFVREQAEQPGQPVTPDASRQPAP